MRKPADQSGLILRSIYAACLLAATSTHVLTLIQHGVLWDYGRVGWASAAFWTSLTVADPVAAACLFIRPRAGLILTCGIIALNVLHNGIVFRDVLLQPSEGHLWTYAAFGLQVAFLLFVIATVRLAWPQDPTAQSRMGTA